MIEKLFWLSFFAMWWLLLLLEVVELNLTTASSFILFGLLGALMTADRHVQELKEKGK